MIESGDKVICVWNGETWEVFEGYIPEVGEKVMCRHVETSNPQHVVFGLGFFEAGDIIDVFPGGLSFDFPPISIPHTTITEPFYDSQYWGNAQYRSSSTKWFNNGDPLPAGMYRITATGWYTIWENHTDTLWCEGDYGTRKPKFYSCCKDNVRLVTADEETPISDITTNRDLSNMTGQGTTYIPGGSVGLKMTDSVYSDNYGSTTYEIERVG
jgi:hypothetical protein